MVPERLLQNIRKDLLKDPTVGYISYDIDASPNYYGSEKEFEHGCEVFHLTALIPPPLEKFPGRHLAGVPTMAIWPEEPVE